MKPGCPHSPCLHASSGGASGDEPLPDTCSKTNSTAIAHACLASIRSWEATSEREKKAKRPKEGSGKGDVQQLEIRAECQCQEALGVG